jgi:hypothetical protein
MIKQALTHNSPSISRFGFQEQTCRMNRIKYARTFFRFALLEYFPMKTDDEHVFAREAYWKAVLSSRGQYGYNEN